MTKTYLDLLEAKFRKPVLMYHGTTDAVLRPIIAQGVIPFPKKRAWGTDKDTSQNQMSRVSVGGSYWTTNVMTARSSAWHARNVMGGKNRIIVAANIQQQGAFSDEDNINFPIKAAFAHVTRKLYGVSDLVWIAFLFFTDNDIPTRETAIDLFIEKFMEDIRKERPQAYELPRAKAEEILRLGILREIAHNGRTNWSLNQLVRAGMPEDFYIPLPAEIEPEFLKVRGDLTRTYKVGVYSDPEASFNNYTLRTEEVVGYRGGNKIVAVMELVEYSDLAMRDEEHIILHYGTIPEDFRRQWRGSVGAWRRVVDPQGRVIEKSDREQIIQDEPEPVLTEGLIAVPQSILDKCYAYAAKMLLWWARDRLQGKAERLPEHAAVFKRMAARFPDIPKEPFPGKDIHIIDVPLDFTDMPDNYSKLTPDRKTIFCALDFRSNVWNNSLGYWHQKKSAMVLCPMNLSWLRRWPDDNGAPDNLELALAEIHESLTHELRHMVQSVLIHDVDPSQLDMHDDYALTKDGKARGAGYYTSPIEFDTTIGSAAHSFLVHYRILAQYGKKPNLSDSIKKFVGAKKGDMFNGFTTEPFFRYWKKKDVEKWRVAVNKFVTEVNRLRTAEEKPVVAESAKRVTVWSGATITVLHNPSREAFQNFTKKHRAVRGLLTYSGEDIWLWDAAMAVHPNLIQELGLEHIDCIAYTDGRWTGPVHDHDGYKPAVQRLTPYVAPKREFSDEELLRILGDVDDEG